VTAFGKLIRTTAFRPDAGLSVPVRAVRRVAVGLFCLEYTRRLITEQITTTVNAETARSAISSGGAGCVAWLSPSKKPCADGRAPNLYPS